MPVEHVTPELTVVAGAGVILVGVLFVGRAAQWLAAPAALLVLAAAAAFTVDVWQHGDPLLSFSGSLAVDGVTHGARLAILGGTAVAVALAPEWVRTDPRRGEYHVLVLLSASGAMLMAGAGDVMQLIVGLLLAAVPGYALAAFHRGSPVSAEAGMKFFLVGGLANVLLLTGIVLLFGIAGTTRLAGIETALAAGTSTPVLAAAVALIAVGVGFEIGAVPAHSWMPDVAQGAPAPAAAYLTSIPKLGALVALMRLLAVLPEAAVGWRPLIAVLAAATMTLGNLAALWQSDVRRLLGWSSVSQSGYALMALVAVGRSDRAVPALLFFLVAYAVANLASFGVVVELRGRTDLDDYAGLAGHHPWLTAALAVALLSLVGIPPLAGFTAKLGLFSATIEAGYGWLAVLAVANTVVSLFYYLRVLAPAYLGEAASPVPVLGRWSARATGASAAAVVAVGVLSGPLLAAFEGAALLP